MGFSPSTANLDGLKPILQENCKHYFFALPRGAGPSCILRVRGPLRQLAAGFVKASFATRTAGFVRLGTRQSHTTLPFLFGCYKKGDGKMNHSATRETMKEAGEQLGDRACGIAEAPRRRRASGHGKPKTTSIRSRKPPAATSRKAKRRPRIGPHGDRAGPRPSPGGIVGGGGAGVSARRDLQTPVTIRQSAARAFRDRPSERALRHVHKTICLWRYVMLRWA